MFRKANWFAIILLGLTLSASEESVDQEHAHYYGEDITRPLNRFDLRVEVQTGVNCSQSSDVIATARTDLLINTTQDWQIGIRADLPYVWYWQGSNESLCGTSVEHVNDSLLQVICIPPSIGKWKSAFGVKVIFPTAADNLQIGDGKYQLLPSAGCRYNLDEWSNGAYAGFIIRQAFSVGGYRSAHYIAKTYIQPFLNINLPDKWYITFSPELIYNWRIRAWFIPFDMMIGKMLNEATIISLEYQNSIVYDYKQFTQSLELRIGYFY